jgi:hypothetical protein
VKNRGLVVTARFQFFGSSDYWEKVRPDKSKYIDVDSVRTMVTEVRGVI